MSNACGTPAPISTGARFGLLAARWLMGGLFLFSGAAKLGWLKALSGVAFLAPVANSGIDPYTFAGSVKGFAILNHDLIPYVTFLVPWLEIVSALALLIGLGTRGAARIIASLLVLFCLAMVTVIIRKLDVDCSCFGKFLGGAVGWTSILRNVVLLAIIWPVAHYGAGMLAREHLLLAPRAPRGE